jgi:large subunit ribosomal protein L29
MKAKDLRERSSEDLQELENTLRKDLFSYRMKNFTNQLDDTCLLKKTRRDLARIELVLCERTRGASTKRGEP